MQRDYLRAGAIGLVAGLAASLAMEWAQAGIARLQSSDDDGQQDGSDSKPATEQAAITAAAATGHHLDDDQSATGGRLVHYATGTALGIAYALAAEREPRVAMAGGLPLAISSMVLLDEVAVPLAGFGDPPTKAPASSHVLSLVSHLAFGLVAEGVRRALGGRAPG